MKIVGLELKALNLWLWIVGILWLYRCKTSQSIYRAIV